MYGPERFGDALARLDPGGDLARLLESTDETKLDDYALVEVVAAWRRVSAWAAARAAAAAARLAERDAMNPAWPEVAGKTGETCVAAEELALRLGISRRSGRELVRSGRAFEGPLWPTGEALDRGAIDEGKARIVVQALADAPIEVAIGVQELVLPEAPSRTHASSSATSSGLSSRRILRTPRSAPPGPWPPAVSADRPHCRTAWQASGPPCRRRRR